MTADQGEPLVTSFDATWFLGSMEATDGIVTRGATQLLRPASSNRDCRANAQPAYGRRAPTRPSPSNSAGYGKCHWESPILSFPEEPGVRVSRPVALIQFRRLDPTQAIMVGSAATPMLTEQNHNGGENGRAFLHAVDHPLCHGQ